MGGKTKSTPRTKNNVRPSSSARAAELLGSTVPTFVGFSAVPDHGIVPFAPGFGSYELLSEHFDGNVDPAYIQVFRKMSKKDPTTKQKALQEFIDMLNEADLAKIKTILPIWPNHYQTLSIDNEHNVREMSQNVQQLLAQKCNRALAPYLKHIVPIWLASQFDNYAPAASIAASSFKQTFVSAVNDRTQEVCLHCQKEIIQHASRQLTFHTAATLSAGKEVSPVEAEQKYQRVVLSSLKMLSFFVERTLDAPNDMQDTFEQMQQLLNQQKFWSFSKHKVPTIKAAWFELIYQLLQSRKLMDVLTEYKTQLIGICFQHIDVNEPILAPHVWGCILLLQACYADWYSGIDFKKSVLPKLNALLSSGFNNNVAAISPNMLPFISKITAESLKDIPLYDFYVQFFRNFKTKMLITAGEISSKMDYSSITKTYFECLRFVLQRLNNLNPRKEEDEQFAERLIVEFVLEPISWFLNSEQVLAKYYFQHTSALLAFMDRQSSIANSGYGKLLNTFWTRIFQIISDKREQQSDLSDYFLQHVLELLHNLHVANPTLEDQKVKFHVEAPANADNQMTKPKEDDTTEATKPTNSVVTNAAFIQNELRELAMQLLRICMAKAQLGKSVQYVQYVRRLTLMFSDLDFYTCIVENGDLVSSLDQFVGLLKRCKLRPAPDLEAQDEETEASSDEEEHAMAANVKVIDKADELEQQTAEETIDIVLNIIFEIIQKLDKVKRFQFIEDELLVLPHPQIQMQVLQRLLSYPLCVEPEVLTMLAKPEASNTIQQIAREVIHDNSREKFNILHKCFFQTDSGEILIGTTTVDAILRILIDALNESHQYQDVVDGCGSFIAQIMPVICNNENATKEMQHEVFLTLFRFTMQHEENDYISKDTLWELTTCWQDALSSNDIQIDEEMLQACAAIIELQLQEPGANINNVNSMAESMAKFILCSTENIENESERYARIDATMTKLFNTPANSATRVQHLAEQCLFLEAIQRRNTAFCPIATKSMVRVDTAALLHRTLLNFSTVMKLVCSERHLINEPKMLRVGNNCNDETDADEVTEDFCDPNENLLKLWSATLLDEMLKAIKIAAMGDTLIELIEELDNIIESLSLELSEKVRVFMRHNTELVAKIVARLMAEAVMPQTLSAACRALPYLSFTETFALFDDNAMILLNEHLAEHFIEGKALSAYVLTLQYMLPQLGPKTITLHDPIMRQDPEELCVKAAMYRCLIINNFSCDYNDSKDRNIISTVLQFLANIAEQQLKQKDLLLYNVEIHKQPFQACVNVTEFINLLSQALTAFPTEFQVKHWDAIRLGLSSWVLSLSKSIEHFNQPQVSMFAVAVYNLFAKLMDFIKLEQQRSSTQLLQNIIEEWHSLFAREVNTILFRSYFNMCNSDKVANFMCFEQLIDQLTPALELIDYHIIYNFAKINSQLTLDKVMNFLLINLSKPLHNMRFSSAHILKQLNHHFIVEDIASYDKRSESYDANNSLSAWHYLNRFEDYLTRYELPIRKYNEEFSFKLTEIADFEPIEREEALSYLLLWDCIIFACANAPIALRSVYTDWLQEHKYEEHFLHFLFRCMPTEILKNHCNKVMNSEYFKSFDMQYQPHQFNARHIPMERYACNLYTEALRKLPALARKWWNSSASRQKTFIDKLTQVYVSPLLVAEELKAISNKKEKHDNMQVTVHTSTREVLAVYSIDEVRMELVITLAQNHPLGSVKVECGKQIGGRATSRNVGMQLTIFLTHQNGSLYDGLTLWKKNLDKKFEGVEECYVCYTVIHQETCQLPKLSCRTCRKKFHGPCLYKWFTTSNKSTCPICRNVF